VAAQDCDGREAGSVHVTRHGHRTD
jgi:hypothetical protein